MKYKLKRPTKKYVIIYGTFFIFGVILMFTVDDLFGLIFTLLSLGFIIYEVIRSNDAEFTFDEGGFCIAETRYSYADIQCVNSKTERYMSNVRITLKDSTQYKFDTNYEGAKRFVKLLTLNGIDHDLFR